MNTKDKPASQSKMRKAIRHHIASKALDTARANAAREAYRRAAGLPPLK